VLHVYICFEKLGVGRVGLNWLEGRYLQSISYANSRFEGQDTRPHSTRQNTKDGSFTIGCLSK